MSVSTRKNSNYIVRCFDGTGARYLVRRARTNGYRWAKSSAQEAEILSYDAARKAAQRHGGNMVAVVLG